MLLTGHFKYLIISLFLLLVSPLVQSQNSDSTFKAQTVLIKNLALSYPDSAILLLEEVKKKNESSDDLRIANLELLEGSVLLYSKQYEEAGKWFSKSNNSFDIISKEYVKEKDTTHLDYYETLRGQARSSNNLGAVYYYLSEQTKSIEWFLKALGIHKRLGMSKNEEVRLQALENIATTTDNIGRLYKVFGDKERALEYARKAYQMLSQLETRSLLGNMLNLAILYNELGQADSSFYYSEKILQQSDSVNTSYEYFAASAMLAERYVERGDFEPALSLVKGVIAYRKKSAIEEKFSNFNLVLPTILYHQNNYIESEYYALKALKLAKETNVNESLRKVYNFLHQLYFQWGTEQSDNALLVRSVDFLKKSTALQDSLQSVERYKEFTELQTKYETEQKDKENLILESQVKEQQLWVLSLSGGGVLLFVLLFISYRFYLERKKVAHKLSEDKKIITKQAEELRALDSFKSRFFANVSHDLRTPLTLIQGYISSIKTGDSYLDTKGEESISKLEANTSKLVMLTDEIKDLILLEDDKLQLKFSRIEIATYMQRLVNLFSSAAESNHVHLNFTSEVDSSLMVHLDSFQFEKIMYNLLANALKFSAKEGHIEVSLSNKEEGILITIKDDGAGIAPDKVAYIFSRYFQASDEIHYNKEGMGIGLALVMELVKLHRGTINVESELGRGSTFFVTLPYNLDKEVTSEKSDLNFIKNNKVLLEELTNTEPLVDLSETKKRTSNAPTVLIVDDHPDIREYIQGIIEDDHIVRQAANGKEALTVLKREKIDIVITDLMMPWMGGHELIEKMKSQEVYKGIPILVISARTTEEDRLKVLEEGVNNFLAKPFQPNELKLRIANALTSSDARTNIWDTLAKDKKKLNDVQKNVLAKVNTLILSRIDDSSLSVQNIADELATSSRNAYNIIKEIAEVNPKDYIKLVKFQYAKDLMKKKKVKSLTEAARAIGMSNATDFSKQFQKKMGVNPTELIDK